jgi:hypothetical protein
MSRPGTQRRPIGHRGKDKEQEARDPRNSRCEGAEEEGIAETKRRAAGRWRVIGEGSASWIRRFKVDAEV